MMLIALILAAGAADPTVALIREVTDDVEALRGLHRKVNLKVELLDGPLFAAQVRKKALEEMTPKVVAEERARWLAFDLAPPDADPAKIMLGVLDEQVAGFYDPREKKLFVRSDLPGGGGNLLRVVLAHEIEHALQDQNFGIPDMASLPDDDVRAARAALLEGDAMAVMTAYSAQRMGRSIPAAIASSAEALQSNGSALLSADMARLRSAPRVVREELLFPYSAGFALVAEAYRRGGFAEVNKLLANPPKSTHEVLHPYAADPPVAVPMPGVPAGAKLLARGRLGELGARLAFEACLDPAAIGDVVPSLAGDAYSIYERHGHVELLWASAWSEDAAQSAVNLLHLLTPCWSEQRGVAQEARIARKSAMVAVVRGDVDLAPLLAPIMIAPRKSEAPAAALRVDGSRFVSAKLGVSGTIPEGSLRRESREELSIERNGSTATLMFVPSRLDDAGIERLAQKTAPDAPLAYAGSADRSIAGQAAHERSFTLEGTGAMLRIDAIPWCGGKATLAVVRVEKSETNLPSLLDSLQPTESAPLACAQVQ
jgi:hypothetical protein